MSHCHLLFMKRNSRYLLTIVLLSLASAVFSQDEIISFGVYVRDASTHETLNSAEIRGMDTDSVNIMKFKPHLQEVVKGSNLFRYLCTVSRRNRYIIKVECKGYDTEYMDVEMKDVEKQRIIDAILLHRPAIHLKEVTVVGSKILMVMKGDTLEYNASALQLSSGSMLDALIRQLPGVELHKGGRITVNGNYVSSLLVNGRDFFKGDPKVALDNLPSYYVDRVKVYHHMSDLRRFQQGDSAQSTEHDPLVMDVKLKRQYAQGWIGSGEFGYGSQNRYQARLFGMRYTEHSGLFVFSNINNLNNTQEAGKDGRWADEGIREGVGTAKTFGLNFTGSDKGSGMKYDTSLKLSLTDLDILRLKPLSTDKNSIENRYSKIQSMQYKYSAAAKYGLFYGLGSKPIQMDLEYKYTQEYWNQVHSLSVPKDDCPIASGKQIQ